jgi:hypothetical protein
MYFLPANSAMIASASHDGHDPWRLELSLADRAGIEDLRQ